jgi:hypothetical protein
MREEVHFPGKMTANHGDSISACINLKWEIVTINNRFEHSMHFVCGHQSRLLAIMPLEDVDWFETAQPLHALLQSGVFGTKTLVQEVLKWGTHTNLQLCRRCAAFETCGTPHARQHAVARVGLNGREMCGSGWSILPDRHPIVRQESR